MLGDVDGAKSACVKTRRDLRAIDPDDVVEFMVEGERLLVHRSTLARQCTFFSNMFRPVFRESIAKVIELKNVSLSAMKMFLKLVHLTEDRLNIDVIQASTIKEEGVSNLMELFELVDMFQHTPLIYSLSQRIGLSINRDNCCKVLAFAERYALQDPGLRDSAECAIRVAAAHFPVVSRSVAYLELDLRLALALLSRDEINIGSELETLNAAVRWFRHNHIPDIFTVIRLYLIPATDLLQYKKDSAVWSALRCVAPALNSDKSGARQRDALRSLYVIGGLDQSAVEVYNIRKKDWSLGTSLPEPRHAACAVTLNSTIYIMGGYVCGKHTSSVLQYRLRENKWTPIESMALARSGAGAAVLHGKIYVCGGRNANRVFESCEVYDPCTKSWSFAPDMNTPRTYHGLTATSNAIYSIGGTAACSGTSDNSQLSTVERYSSGTWSFLHPLSLPLMAPGSCTVEDTVYVFGGRNLSHTVISYSHSTTAYSLERPMSVPRGQGVKTVCVGDMIYCIGGCPGFGTLRSMDRFDTTTKTWSALPSKSFPQGSTCFTVM